VAFDGAGAIKPGPGISVLRARVMMELTEAQMELMRRVGAGGEGGRGVHEYRGMLEKDSLGIIQFEVCLIGPTLARQVATLAASYHKPCVSHAGFGPGVICAGHMNASLQNGVFFGPTRGTGPTWELIHEPPVIDIEQMWTIYENAPRLDKDGYMQLSDKPGLGVTIRPDLLQDA
jgi:L-alanine-DL-glutamate epimerase-like enolase superfamily enzyme